MARARVVLLVSGLVLVAALAIAVSHLAPRASAAFHPRSLVGATDEEVGRYAIDDTTTRFHILGGPPTVVLVRQITAADFSSLGLGGTIHVTRGNPTLKVVVLHGDFDVANLFPNLDPPAWHSRAAYLIYAFDVGSGFALFTGTSDHPVVNPPGGTPVTITPSVAPASSPSAAPGDIAPMVAPPGLKQPGGQRAAVRVPALPPAARILRQARALHHSTPASGPSRRGKSSPAEIPGIKTVVFHRLQTGQDTIGLLTPA